MCIFVLNKEKEMTKAKDKKEIRIYVPLDLHRKIDIYRTVNAQDGNKKNLADASVELLRKALS